MPLHVSAHTTIESTAVCIVRALHGGGPLLPRGRSRRPKSVDGKQGGTGQQHLFANFAEHKEGRGCRACNSRRGKRKIARELLERLKQLLVLNWRQKAAARSQLRLAIEDTLEAGLPRAYTPELYQQKCSAVFEHVYESYPERDASSYALAG